MKRLWIVLLISFLYISTLVGCSLQNQLNRKNERNQQLIEISMLIKSHPSYPYNEDWWIWKAIEQNTNVNLRITAVPNLNYVEKLNIAAASGNVPDIVSVDRAEANRLGLEGRFINIKNHIYQMPNLSKWVQQYSKITAANMAADGGLYLLPTEGMGETERRAWLYREDIFKKNNINTPENSDELLNALKTLKEKYPNSYPFVLRLGLTSLSNFQYIAPQWNTSHGYYYNEKKAQWKYGPVEENYKNMIMFFRNLYQEKLIPPDFMTINTKQWQDMIASDKAFVTVDYINRIDFFNVALRKENPAFNLSFMTPPSGGKNGVKTIGYSHSLTQAFALSSRTDHINAVLDFIDYFYSEAGSNLMSWGIEGETYQKIEGEKRFIDIKDMADLRKKYGISTVGTYLWFDYNAHMSTFSEQLKAAIVTSRTYDNTPTIIPSFTEDEYNQLINNNGERINQHTEQEITKFILGMRDINEWDQYVEEINSMGLDKMIETYDNAYKRMIMELGEEY